mmetsp:Transcript_14825/g.34260  ORF Transcript_14825/g.34260 Transcript_14825/m.34260 type:complete len:451 (-) Transcript_14825:114-1466(-)
MREREDRRRPLEPANSRFAAAEVDRERGPPPTQNSRFAAAAEADRDYGGPGRGPPPVPQNSRFAAAAAAAAAEAEREAMEREDRYRDRDFRNSGPPPQNSRFAAAVAADEDYVPEERRRGGGGDDRFHDRRDGGYDRDGPRDGGYDRGGPRDGGGYDRGYGGRDDRRGGGRFDDRGRFDSNRGYDDHRPPPPEDRFDDRRGKGNVDNILKPKQADHPADNVLKAPEHMDNMLIPPTKAAAPEHADNFLVPPKPKEEKAVEPKKEEEVVTETPALDAADTAGDEAALLDEFISGKQGEELKQWVAEKGASLPSVEKLVFHFLHERELLNPDPECEWANASKYGAALLSLVEDDTLRQMEVLWGIQKYCDKLGFPKLNEEYLVQSMFRSMYKYDLAENDAFAEWKEDESDEHNEGKLKAVIQTVDWFNWLEEDDDDDDDDEEDYEDDYEEEE